MARVLVIVATYNEAENLPSLAEQLLAIEPPLDVLVVDDNSPDGTGRIADELAEKTGRVKVIHRPGKLGLGSAEIAGLRRAIEDGYDYALTMDADFSHDPKYIPDLIAGMAEHDLMQGSRYVPGGGTVGWPWHRKLMSRAANLWVRVVLGLKLADCSGAFKCYSVEKLKALDLGAVRSQGYSFQEEILFHCQRAGWRIGETPIIFVERRAGQSKINSSEAFGLIWTLLKVRVGAGK